MQNTNHMTFVLEQVVLMGKNNLVITPVMVRLFIAEVHSLLY